MINKIITNKKRILAILMTIAIVFSSISMAIAANESSENKSVLDSYTVAVKVGNNSIDLNNIVVTMTNKEDESDTAKAKTVRGEATFKNFVVVGETYIIEVGQVNGCKPVSPVEVTVESGITVDNRTTIRLEELETKTVKGRVKNEDGNACGNATVCIISDDVIDMLTTDKNGEFHYDLIAGKKYSMTVSGVQYEEQKFEIGEITEDLFYDVTLKYKRFNVKATIENGTADIKSSVVKYGDSAVVSIDTNKGYRISEVKVGNVKYDDAKDSKSYILTLKNIKEDVNVEISTYRKEYSVNVSYSGEGKIYEAEFDLAGKITDITEDSKAVTNGGVIKFYESDKVGFVATAATGYHISKIKIDGEVLKNDNYNDNSFNSFKYEFIQNKDWEIEVEFSLNVYTVKVEATKGGTIEIAKNKVSHGASTEQITIKANDGYDVEGILINGVAPDAENLEAYEFKMTDEEAYTFVVPNITGDTTVKVVYKKYAIEEAKWNDVLDIEATKGSLVKETKDSDGNDVLIFTAKSELKITPKTPYTHLKIKGINNSLKEEAAVISSMEIKEFTVKTISNIPWETKSANSAASEKTLKIVFDGTAPVLEDIPAMEGWSKVDTYTISGKANDVPGEKDMNLVSGVSYIVWSRGKSLSAKEIKNASDSNKVVVNEDGTYSFDVKGEHNNEKYYIYAVDNAGNISEAKTVDIKIDLTDPEIVSFTFRKQQNSALEDSINFFTFGTLFREGIEVSVGFVDENVSSGVKKVTVYSVENSEKAEKKVVGCLAFDETGMVDKELTKNIEFLEGKAILILNENEFNNTRIAAEVEDWSGRISEIKMPTQVETNANSNNVIVNTVEPEVVITIPEAEYTEIIETEDSEETTSKLWYSKDIEFNVDISAESFVGINSVVVTLNGVELETDINDQVVNQNYAELITDENGNKVNKLTDKLSFKFSTTQYAPEGEDLEKLLESGEYKLEVKVKSNSTVETVKTSTVYIDRTNPDVAKFEIKLLNGDAAGTALNYLTFGTFFNTQVKVVVEPEDIKASSGLKSVTLYANGEFYEEAPVEVEEEKVKDEETGEERTEKVYFATFKVPAEEITESSEGEIYFSKAISAVATDNVGRVTDEKVIPTTGNSDMKNSNLMVETSAPVVTIKCRAADYVDDQGKNWYKDNVNYTIHVSDVGSGIRSIEVYLNEEKIELDLGGNQINGNLIETEGTEEKEFKNFYDCDEATFEKEFEINTSQISKTAEDGTKKINTAPDGSITLNVHVVDNAGNENDKKDGSSKKTAYFDEKAPSIIKFDFAPEKPDALYQDGVASEEAPTVEITDYGFYFTDNTVVKITAKDENPSSGLEYIEYFMINEEGEEVESGSFPVEEVEKSTDDGADGAITGITYEGSISVLVKKDFKGQIYARPKDNAGNYPTDNTERNGFVNPNGTIVESKEKHEEEKHVLIDAENQVKSVYTKDGVKLFAETVPVLVTVIDTYSGIRKVDWEVKADYDKEKDKKGSLTVENGGTLTGDEGWTVVDNEKNSNNLVTKIQKTVNVENNSNNIELIVTMEDRAGNKSTLTEKISIDTTKPEITVVYDNNNADMGKYYKADRTATITIKERNFDPSGIASEIYDEETGRTVQISSWTPTEDTKNPDNNTHTATVTYNSDGAYRFKFGYTDLAGNASDQTLDEDFVIDKTAPIVSVGYDNNSSLNNNYYKADRVATISITEHNFDASRVIIMGSADSTTGPVTFPAESEWTVSSTNPDLNIATIRYSADAIYEFDIEFMDMAGNPANDVAKDTFIIDKTAPTLEITGVANLSANADKVAPVIKYTDTNFNPNGAVISLTGFKNGAVDNYASTRTETENGQIIAYADFERVKDVDDVYILNASVTDLAGNTSNKAIRFSANRFGSVYTFDPSYKAIKDKFITTEQEIVFTETNVDALTAGSIKVRLVKNGVSTDLKEGKISEGDDYEIISSGGDGSWSQYDYRINKSLFATDGRYSISVYSVDAAGNVNQNTDETKEAEISFGIDKTNPEIVPSDLKSHGQYNESNKIVSVEIKDNLVLEEVSIYVDGEKVKFANDGNIYTFSIPEKSEKQSVRIIAIDAAGNRHEFIAEDVVVSTNFFVRWYNNTPLFVGTVGGLAGLAILAAVIVIVKKRKEDDE
ncbi:MAG: hypothetical protein IKU08_06715 [Clostridia bacterium]|nr:hypothetical protein [Clostridia bacterium]